MKRYPVSTDEVVEQLNHLNPQHKKDLKEVIKYFEKLFDGTLGVYSHKKFHIKLIPGAKAKDMLDHTPFITLKKMVEYIWSMTSMN